MPKPKTLSGGDVVRIFAVFGFEVAAQRGGHIKLRRVLSDGTRQTLLYPIIANLIEALSLASIDRRCDISRQKNSHSIFSTNECAKLFRCSQRKRDCRSVELRALCNEVPRTPPGPEGSNGIGNASGAAVHPKFLASFSRQVFCSRQVFAIARFCS